MEQLAKCSPENLAGYSLKEALIFLQEKYDKIIKIIKVVGNNKKFGILDKPYVIKNYFDDKYITLYITYY